MFRPVKDNRDIITVGYMLLKSENEKNDNEALKRDLVQLGVFGKDAIVAHKVKSTFLIQAIGTELTFYILCKKAEDVFVMLELDCIKFPTTVNEMPALFGYFERIANVVKTFRYHMQINKKYL